MIMPVFLDSEAVFTHIIVGTFLAFVSGAHNREQITLVTPEKNRISLKKVKTNQNQIIRSIHLKQNDVSQWYHIILFSQGTFLWVLKKTTFGECVCGGYHRGHIFWMTIPVRKLIGNLCI